MPDDVRILQYQFFLSALRVWIFHNADEVAGRKWEDDCIAYLVAHFRDIIDGGGRRKMERHAVRDDEDVERFVITAFWLMKMFPGFDTLRGDQIRDIVFMECEVDVPDGTVYFSCPRCGTIVKAYEDSPDIMRPVVCPHCAGARFPEFKSNWDTVSTPKDPNHGKVRRYVASERRYWSDGPIGRLTRLKTKIGNGIRYRIWKATHPFEYKTAIEHLRLK
jgi:predicted RNA-binding Zn-ribbon protein involved in translation (DUF1610 family)